MLYTVSAGTRVVSASPALSLPARQAGGPAVAGRASIDNCSNSVPLALSTHPKITNLHPHNTEDRYLYKLIERFKGIVRGHRVGCGGEEGIGGYFCLCLSFLCEQDLKSTLVFNV